MILLYLSPFVMYLSFLYVFCRTPTQEVQKKSLFRRVFMMKLTKPDFDGFRGGGGICHDFALFCIHEACICRYLYVFCRTPTHEVLKYS